MRHKPSSSHERFSLRVALAILHRAALDRDNSPVIGRWSVRDDPNEYLRSEFAVFAADVLGGVDLSLSLRGTSSKKVKGQSSTNIARRQYSPRRRK